MRSSTTFIMACQLLFVALALLLFNATITIAQDNTTSLVAQGNTTNTNTQDALDTAAARRKHNVIFILTDDQDQRMDSLSHMPKVQKFLIDEGTWYQRHYAPLAFCCPARVSIWTGLHAHNHQVSSITGKWGGWKKILEQGLNSKYLPIWLRDHGYKTYYSGKLYNGMSEKNGVEETTARGWDEAVSIQPYPSHGVARLWSGLLEPAATSMWRRNVSVLQPNLSACQCNQLEQPK